MSQNLDWAGTERDLQEAQKRIKALEAENKRLRELHKQAKYFYDKGDMSDMLHSRFFKPGHETCTEGTCVMADTDPCE